MSKIDIKDNLLRVINNSKIAFEAINGLIAIKALNSTEALEDFIEIMQDSMKLIGRYVNDLPETVEELPATDKEEN